MTPSHVRKRSIKYRYYISSALLQGRPKHFAGDDLPIALSPALSFPAY